MSEVQKALTKNELRCWISTRLNELSREQKSDHSQKIVSHLYQHLGLKSGQFVAFFAGMSSEPDLAELMKRYWREGVRVVMLAIDPLSPTMDAYEVTQESDLQVGRWKVLEPIPLEERKVPRERMEVFLVPGVAFHPKTGARLGRGKGYYDRYLEGLPFTRKVGVCFSCQLLEAVVSEAHDVEMTHLVHELGFQRLS